MNNDRIKEVILKLMAVAGDGSGASEGEIDNALRLAAKLQDEHHLTADDIKGTTPDDVIQPLRVRAKFTTQRVTGWEIYLGNAILDLIGTVIWVKGEPQPLRVNGVAKVIRGHVPIIQTVDFCGPVQDAREAADLFEEWARLIAAMAVIRWGGAYRGNGAQYATGFAKALRDKAAVINAERIGVQARAPRLTSDAAKGGAITLANRYLKIREAAQIHVYGKVKKGKGRSRNIKTDVKSNAYQEGRAEGSRAGFGRRAQVRGHLT